jgi:hypothetical protein
MRADTVPGTVGAEEDGKHNERKNRMSAKEQTLTVLREILDRYPNMVERITEPETWARWQEAVQ